MVPFWLFGIVLVVFPNAVHDFYRWFHDSDFERCGNQPRHVRNAGIVWLIVMGVSAYFR